MGEEPGSLLIGGITLGIGVGAAIGFALGAIALGMGVGLGAGLLGGAALALHARTQRDEHRRYPGMSRNGKS